MHLKSFLLPQKNILYLKCYYPFFHLCIHLADRDRCAGHFHAGRILADIGLVNFDLLLVKDLANAAGKNVKLFNALNGSSESVKNWLGEEIDVIAIVITSADVPSIMGDDDSERVCKPCVHFFTLDGSHISSISNGIIKATKMLLSCGFLPSEEEPIRIRFKEVETKKGTAHTFDMI